jgi:N-acetylglucosamine-6-sulfatase
MRRRRSGASMAFLLVLASAVTSTSLRSMPSATASAQDGRPNVVVILTDDQTVAMLEAMPATRRLIGGRGLTFTEAIAPFPLCCPSRATLISGRYATNHRIATNAIDRRATPELEQAYLDLERTSLPTTLQAAGYFTGFVGKDLHGYLTDPQPPAGWDDWRSVVDLETYQSATLSDNGRIEEHPRHLTDVLADEAVQMIEQASADDRPFFVELSNFAPHSASEGPVWAPRHADLFGGVRAPRTPAFGEADARDKRNPHPPLTRQATAQIDRHWRASLRSLQAVDEAVARVVGALRAAGELEDTMLVFTSDNGYFYGEHRLPNEKYLPYESSIRVPWLMAGPMVPPEDRGDAVDVPVAGIDLLPTILHYAGVRPPVPVDGVSVHRVLEGGRPRAWAQQRHLLLYGRRTNGCSCAPDYSGVRTTRWMYWTSQHGDELYDLAVDPHELTNLADDPAYRAIVHALDASRRALLACQGAACGRPSGWTPWFSSGT